MRNSKILSGILCISCLSISIFTSCSTQSFEIQSESLSDPKISETPDTTCALPTETTLSPKVLSDLPDVYDLDGYELRVINQSPETLTWLLNTFAPEEANADPLNDEIYQRNSRVCERYNFKIQEIHTKSDPASTVFKSVQAGDNEYDVTCSMLTNAKKLMEGSVLNLAEVPNLNLEKPYWNQQILKELKINDKIFAMTGDLLLSDDDAMMILIYNRQLADKNNIENLYDTVRDGKWTYDKMLSCIKAVSSDLNNDGKYTEDDRYGMVYLDPSSIQQFYAASDARIYSKATGTAYPEFVADNEHATDTFTKYNALLSDSALSFPWSRLSNVPTEQAAKLVNMLNNDQFLFQSIVLSMVRRNYREVTTDFGILVHPKLDETQETYKTCISLTTPYMFIVSTTNAEKTGFALEALAADSYHLTDTYYQICMESKYTRDKESFEMIRLASQNIVFDLGFIYNFGDVFGKIQQSILNTNAPYSSMIAKNKEKADAQMKKLFNTVSGS